MAATNRTDSVLSRIDIPEQEQQEITELYKNAVLRGSTAQLISPTGDSRRLPPAVYDLLVQILRDLSEGSSIAILQERKGLTTVQASKLLGVSRQFFVNLLDRGEIPHHMVGTHRRVAIKDLMAYKAKRDRDRRAVLKEMVRTESDSYHIVSQDDLSE